MKNEIEKKKGPSAKRVEINPELCKGCGICAAFCPKKSLTLTDHDKAVWTDPEKCEHCGLCELRCQDLAIEVIQ